jgi:hypothetical protein
MYKESLGFRTQLLPREHPAPQEAMAGALAE